MAKRYRTRRYRSNLTAWSWTCVPLGVGVLVATVLTGNKWVPLVALSVVAVGFAIAWWRDRIPDITYGMDREKMTLGRGGIRREVPLEEVMDVNLIDRSAARQYVQRTVRSQSTERREMRKATRALLRYCTVDIGMASLSFGIGRSMIDRLPNGKDDLLLLRLRTGEQFLLSPQYPHDVITAVDHMILDRHRPVPIARAQQLAVAHPLAHPQGGA
ncbi:MAG TPA: hypothetical protein VGE21_08010 [Flavobacteriales bacterium]